MRRIPQAFEHVRQGGWDRTEFRGSEIYEKTVGIIGYGRLGRIVASYFRAMGANVMVPADLISEVTPWNQQPEPKNS